LREGMQQEYTCNLDPSQIPTARMVGSDLRESPELRHMPIKVLGKNTQGQGLDSPYEALWEYRTKSYRPITAYCPYVSEFMAYHPVHLSPECTYRVGLARNWDTA
jgi:hypothetical protein